jgi:hypothetical protein
MAAVWPTARHGNSMIGTTLSVRGEQLATEAKRIRIAAFPAKIARWADADGFNEAFILHWRRCFSIPSRSKQVRTAAGGTPPFRATPTPQRRISICRIEWASGSRLMRHPAVSVA